jgi:hypothetical protein
VAGAEDRAAAAQEGGWASLAEVQSYNSTFILLVDCLGPRLPSINVSAVHNARLTFS